LGNLLARFHLVLSKDIPPGKEGLLREDHPDLLLPYVSQLQPLCHAPAETLRLDRLARHLELVRTRLDQALYPKLPRAIIHGDIHPGNVKFKNGQVVAVYDFDYLSEQARCRDLVDALMFFGSERLHRVDPEDIRSLTQPFVPKANWSSWLLDGYQQVSPLLDLEWEALPWLMRSQWLQIRLRGSRKVPPGEKLSFVLDRFFDVIAWLEQRAVGFFRGLQARAGSLPQD
jgi:Ser/Thr protein kinase RdoA (MazF antagonist)